MIAQIRVDQALLLNNGDAIVRWVGPNGNREKRVPLTHADSWVQKLARVVFSDPGLREASINAELNIHGTLRWDKYELELEFDPDPKHDGHTRTVLIRMVQDA